MKKTVLTFLFIFFSFMLFGCMTYNDIDNYQKIKWGNGGFNSCFITSTEELGIKFSPNDGLDEKLTKYSDTYFEKFTLVAFNVIENSGSIEVIYKGYKVNGNNIDFAIKENVPNIVTDDMASYLFLVDIAKEELNGVESISINGKKIVQSNDKLIDIENINFEQISYEELKYLYDNNSKYFSSIGQINNKKYGRIINSSSSTAAALEVAIKHFTDTRYWYSVNTVIEVKLDIETELFYGLYVKWEHNSEGEKSYFDEYVISFKTDIYDCTVKKLINDNESSIFKTADKDQIKKVLDYKCYSITNQIYGCGIVYSEILDFDEYYTYKAYSLETVYGDWGLQDTVSMICSSYNINKTTGEISLLSNKILKTINIDGINTYSNIE